MQQSQYCLLATLVPASQQYYPSFGSCDPQLQGIYQTRALVRFAISQILACYIVYLRHTIYTIVVILPPYNLASRLLAAPPKFQFPQSLTQGTPPDHYINIFYNIANTNILRRILKASYIYNNYKPNLLPSYILAALSTNRFCFPRISYLGHITRLFLFNLL